MAKVSNFAVSDVHVHQMMRNAFVGGQIIQSVTGASSAIGGFAVATSSDNGVCTVTWSADYGSAPLLLVLPIVAATATSNNVGVPVVAGIASGSAAIMGRNTSGGSANVSMHVIGFGPGTGTRIT